MTAPLYRWQIEVFTQRITSGCFNSDERVKKESHELPIFRQLKLYKPSTEMNKNEHDDYDTTTDEYDDDEEEED